MRQAPHRVPVEADWSHAEVNVTQRGDAEHIALPGAGDLDATAIQIRRFLSLD